MSKDAPLAIEVPESRRDNPGWIKVGVIAAVGFIVGIAWPRVMGVRLGMAAPGESAAAASASASAHGGRAPEPPPASVVAKGPAPTAPAASAPAAASATPVVSATSVTAAAPPNISVQKGSVLSCKTADGDTKKGKECGPVPGIDQFVSPRVRKIASCAGAEGQTGKLSLVVNADFASNRFSYDVGKSSTIQNPDAVAACLKTTFHGTAMNAAPHEHPRYTIAYTAVFAPGGAATDEDKTAAHKDKGDRADTKDKSERSAKDTPDEKPERSELASGEAQVAWEVASVRDAPKTGTVVTRLPRGTRVKVGSTKDGWFHIKFGEGFANDGWVHRSAIGR